MTFSAHSSPGSTAAIRSTTIEEAAHDDEQARARPCERRRTRRELVAPSRDPAPHWPAADRRPASCVPASPAVAPAGVVPAALAATTERRSRRPRARPPRRLLRHQPGPRVGGGRRRVRKSAQRLLATAPRRGFHVPPARTRPSRSRLLDHGYGLTNAARRTTRGSSDLRRADFDGSSRAARDARRRAPAARDRVRRQGGVRGAVSRAPRARSPGAALSVDRCSTSSRRRRPRTRRFRTPSAFAGSRRCARCSSRRRAARRARSCSTRTAVSSSTAS